MLYDINTDLEILVKRVEELEEKMKATKDNFFIYGYQKEKEKIIEIIIKKQKYKL